MAGGKEVLREKDMNSSTANKTQDFLTYAVSLCFDSDSSKKIANSVKELSEITGNHYLVENDVPPHLTLGMFHVPCGKEENIRSVFEDFLKEAIFKRAFCVEFCGTDTFLQKVVFVSVKESSASFLHLKELNEALHEKFIPHFAPGGNKNYLPGQFFPHVALAVKLTPDEFKKAQL